MVLENSPLSLEDLEMSLEKNKLLFCLVNLEMTVQQNFLCCICWNTCNCWKSICVMWILKWLFQNFVSWEYGHTCYSWKRIFTPWIFGNDSWNNHIVLLGCLKCRSLILKILDWMDKFTTIPKENKLFCLLKFLSWQRVNVYSQITFEAV